MNQFSGFLSSVAACAALLLPQMAAAEVPIPPSINTPDKVESRLGPLEFKDGAPNAATAAKLYDHVDFTHAYNAFVDTMQGVSIAAIRKGVGAKQMARHIFKGIPTDVAIRRDRGGESSCLDIRKKA
jgi:hypothetical protein